MADRLSHEPLPGIEPLALSGERRAAMLDALWEQSALLALLHELSDRRPDEPHEVSELLHQVRGITGRVRSACELVMAGIGDDAAGAGLAQGGPGHV